MSVKDRTARTWSMSVKGRTNRSLGQQRQLFLPTKPCRPSQRHRQNEKRVCPPTPHDRQEWGRGWGGGRMHAGRHGNGTPLRPEPSGLAGEPGGVQCSCSPPAPWSRHPIRNAAADCGHIHSYFVGRTPSVWKGSE